MASLWERLKRQLDTNDGGATFSNPTPRKQAPAQTPAPKQNSMSVIQGARTPRPSQAVSFTTKQPKAPQIASPSFTVSKPPSVNTRIATAPASKNPNDPIARVVKPVANIAKGFVEAYDYLGKGVGESLAYNTKTSQDARSSAAGAQAAQLQAIKRAGQKLRDPTVSATEKARWQNVVNKSRTDSNSTFNIANDRNKQLLERTNPVKGGMAVGSVGFDIATAGMGTAGVKGAKLAGRQATKQVGMNLAKQKFASEAEKQVAIQAAKQLAKSQSRKAVAKELTKQAGIGAALAAPSGALSVGIQKGKDATAKDYALGAAGAAAFGAAIPIGTYGISRGFNASKNAAVRNGWQVPEIKNPALAGKNGVPAPSSLPTASKNSTFGSQSGADVTPNIPNNTPNVNKQWIRPLNDKGTIPAKENGSTIPTIRRMLGQNPNEQLVGTHFNFTNNADGTITANKPNSFFKPGRLNTAEQTSVSKVLNRDPSASEYDIYNFAIAQRKVAGESGTPQSISALQTHMDNLRSHEVAKQNRVQQQRTLAQRINDAIGLNSQKGSAMVTDENGNMLPTFNPKKKVDPTAALKQEALKYKTAEEFVRANQSSPEIKAAEAKLAEIEARPDYQDFIKGGKITGKTWNDNNAAGVEYRKALDANTKQLTDLYNQAHSQPTPKVEAPQPTVAPVQKPKPVSNAAIPAPVRANTTPKGLQRSQTVGNQTSQNPSRLTTEKLSSTPTTPLTKPKTQPSLQQSLSNKKPQLKKTASLSSTIPPVAKDVERVINGTPLKDKTLNTRLSANSKYPEPVRQMLEGKYVVRDNKTTIRDAKALIYHDPQGAEVRALAPKNAVDVQIGAELFNKYTAEGNFEKAVDFVNASDSTTHGQMIQILSQYDKTTPQGAVKYAQTAINKYNKAHPNSPLTLDTKTIENIVKKAEDIQKMPQGRDRNIASQELMSTVNKLMPSTFADKAITLWKAGLLTSPRTHLRNTVGNTVHGITEMAKDPIAALNDLIVGRKTGSRSMTATTKGTVTGAKEGARVAKEVFKTGYDPLDDIVKYDSRKVNWGDGKAGKAAKVYTDTVFNLLGAEDKPFYHAAYHRSLYDQAGARAANAGKKGDKAFIENLVQNPTSTMLKTATEDAAYSTFKNTNIITDFANKIKGAARKNQAADTIVNVVAPFTGVPSSIAGQLVDYSPIGLVRGIAKDAKLVKNAKNMKKADVLALQRKASQEVGRGVIGSGLLGLGAWMTAQGMMTGQPKDAEEARQWETEGIQANSVMVNGKWRSINSIGPEALVILAGSKLKNSDGLGEATAKIGKDFMSQTFLQGVQAPLNAINDPKRYGATYVPNQVASVVPNIVKDTAKAFDDKKRETKVTGNLSASTWNAIKNSIPGARNTLLPDLDALGNEIKQEPSGVGAYFDIFNSKTPTNNKVATEIGRLAKVDPDNKDLRITPADITTTFGKNTKLTPAQRNELQRMTGGYTQQQWGKLVDYDGYKKLSNEEKAAVLTKLKTDTTAIQKYVFGKSHKLSAKAPTKRQQALMNGKISATDYIDSDMLNEKVTPKKTSTMKTKTTTAKKKTSTAKSTSSKSGGTAKKRKPFDMASFDMAGIYKSDAATRRKLRELLALTTMK